MNTSVFGNYMWRTVIVNFVNGKVEKGQIHYNDDVGFKLVTVEDDANIFVPYTACLAIVEVKEDE